MNTIKALHIGRPALIRNLALTALLAVAVAVSPKQAHADGVETAAAIMIGAAVLYAAHDSYKDDRRYSKSHSHDGHNRHQVSYRDTGHHHYSNSYNNSHRKQKVYTDVHAGHSSHKYYKGKDYKKGKDYRDDKHDNRSDHFARNDRNRYQQGGNSQHGRGDLNDRQKHNQAYWNTRVNVSQRH